MVCEQAHRQLKEELGLDHFEGRSWIGLHRHALMTMIAYAFLQTRRLKAAGQKKRIGKTPQQRACRPSGKQYWTSSRAFAQAMSPLLETPQRSRPPDLPK